MLMIWMLIICGKVDEELKEIYGKWKKAMRENVGKIKCL